MIGRAAVVAMVVDDVLLVPGKSLSDGDTISRLVVLSGITPEGCCSEARMWLVEKSYLLAGDRRSWLVGDAGTKVGGPGCVNAEGLRVWRKDLGVIMITMAIPRPK